MEVRLAGTGGDRGWPRPDCRCASCERARSAGRRRASTRVLVDGVLSIDPGTPSVPGPAAPGYRVERVPGAWAVTGPDGTRLLIGDGPGDGDRGTPPRAGAGAAGAAGGAPYDLVLLDLLGSPAQLGALRRRGLPDVVRSRTRCTATASARLIREAVHDELLPGERGELHGRRTCSPNRLHR